MRQPGLRLFSFGLLALAFVGLAARPPLPEAEIPSTVVAGPPPVEPVESVLPVAAAAPNPAAVHPVRVRVPEIGVDAAVIDLGVTAEGTLEVPEDFAVTGWYTGRALPGEIGPSIVVGHVDSYTGPAVFFHLRDLDPGQFIKIDRSDGFVAWFRVSRVQVVDKDEFPTAAVYGATTKPELRLITCGGDFDRSVRSYEGNLIVFADHLGNFPTGSPALVG